MSGGVGHRQKNCICARAQGQVLDPEEAVTFDQPSDLVYDAVAIGDLGGDGCSGVIEQAADGEAIPAETGVVLRPVKGQGGWIAIVGVVDGLAPGRLIAGQVRGGDGDGVVAGLEEDIHALERGGCERFEAGIEMLVRDIALLTRKRSDLICDAGEWLGAGALQLENRLGDGTRRGNRELRRGGVPCDGEAFPGRHRGGGPARQSDPKLVGTVGRSKGLRERWVRRVIRLPRGGLQV